MKRNIEELDDTSGDSNHPATKRTRQSRFEGAAADSPSDSVQDGVPSSQNIQQLLANTKKQIEERKKQTQFLLAQQKLPAAGLLPTPAKPPVNMYPVVEPVMSPAMSEAVEKARKAAEVMVAN